MTISNAEWKTLFKELDVALELPDDQRQSWLARSTGIPDRLKATLQQMLLHQGAPETNDFLHALPQITLTGVALAPDDAPPDLIADLVIGPYKLIRELGYGGMGAVWLAERTDGQLKRNVALKLPYAGGAYRKHLAERFARERDILAQLTHPHIARLYDAGVAADGQAFLALEYVEGKPITAHCTENKLSIPARLALFQQVLDAVQYAHANLVLHRDLKPNNMLVTAAGEVKLLDFGIAKLMTEGEAHESALTHAAGRILTPDYASPEQIAGATVSTASDVYSLGVLLYELLTGKRPYQLKKSSLGALEQAILATETGRPSARIVTEAQAEERATTLSRLKKTLAGDLDTIVLKALKKSPAERYATVDAFAQDIQRYATNEPILTRADSRLYRLRKFVARNMLAVGATAAVVLALTVGLIGTLTQAHRATQQRDLALAALERSEIVTDFFALLINDVPPDKRLTIGELMVRAESMANKEFADTPEHQAAILGVLGQYYSHVSNPTKALPLLEKASGLLSTSADATLRTNLTCLRGYAMFYSGQDERAVRDIQQALTNPDVGGIEAADCLTTLSHIAQEMGKAEDAYQFAKRALERLRQSSRRHPHALATITGRLAGAQAFRGHNAEADQLYASALAQLTALGRERTLWGITERHNWAIMSLGAGDIKTAFAQFDMCLQLSTQREAGKQPATYLLVSHALALESSGRYAEAIVGYQRAIEAGEDSTPIWMVYATAGLVSAYRALGEIDQANFALAQMRQLVEGKFPLESRAAFSLVSATGKMAASLGQLDQAYKAFSQIIDGPGKTKVSPTTRTLTLLNRAEVALQQSRLAEAMADAREAEQLGLKLQGGKPYSSFTGRALLLQGKILQQQGDKLGARKAFQLASEHLLNAVGPDLPETKQAALLLAALPQ